ncbi:MAG: cytochrome c maturation protein CcmE [Chloroflexi bacterium]|nr:cytochrome c maturation protein CcmE [Chloroflexota bacterium]
MQRPTNIQPTQARARKGKRKRRFLIAGGIVLLIIAYLAYAGFKSSAHYYLTVDEMLAKGEAAYNEQQIRLGGKVVEDSVKYDGLGKALKFTVSGGDRSVPVVYTGVVPDTFKPGADVVLEGRLNRSNVFEAEQLMAKCPSKFVPFVK